MRTIGVLTTSRSDWSGYRPILRLMKEQQELVPIVYAGCPNQDLITMADLADYRWARLSNEFGPYALGRELFHKMENRQRYFKTLDLLLVLGDRYEMLAGAMAAVPFNIPIAHIHGGEETVGAIDNQCRNALTKLAHIHFVATEKARERVLKMGEDPEHVHLTGSPAIDNLRQMIEARGGMDALKEHILVTYHPETLSDVGISRQIEMLIEGLDQCSDYPILFTTPNQDEGRDEVVKAIEQYFRTPSLAPTLGPEKYLEAMLSAKVMVGNSSSGMIEAEYLGLPVVNVGDRQQGREHGANVIDVPCKSEYIANAIRSALAWPPQQRGWSHYGDGHAAPRIVKVLKETELGMGLLRKRFVDA